MTALSHFKAVLAATAPGAAERDTTRARQAIAAAHASLESAGLTPPSHRRLAAALDNLLLIYSLYQRVSDPDRSVILAYARGEPMFADVLQQLKSARSALEDALVVLPVRAVNAEGFTVRHLQDTAGITRQLWQKLCRKAGIEGARGHSNRRLSNAELSRLAQAARDHDTPKAVVAADQWQRLVDMNRQGLAEHQA